MIKHQPAKYIFFIACLLCSAMAQAAFTGSDSARSTLPVKNETAAQAFRHQLVTVAAQEHNRWNNGATARENDTAMDATMKDYWANLGMQVKSSQLRDSLWQEYNPWSAAFISWVMRQAGAGASFRYAASHAEYIAAARNNTMPVAIQFKAYETTDSLAAWPQPGDLLCKNRGGKSYTLGSIKKGCISHCDIVTEVNPANRTVTTIGGNLNNRVAKRLVQLDEKGLIDRNIVWCINDDPDNEFTGTQEDFFAIIKVAD
ncbi:DUF2272 domain-containing protein [Foetidibacter luteolus]|uniref:DUF2272 domain-containing protein n=1 Tax=Foetidibacter luteolus TaxID=2608880 RepID=UPI00129A96D0|nr:DUF2272 domain-containing protein [Foetidibacter luteolus]